jgi:hypothetical protein
MVQVGTSADGNPVSAWVPAPVTYSIYAAEGVLRELKIKN